MVVPQALSRSSRRRTPGRPPSSGCRIVAQQSTETAEAAYLGLDLLLRAQPVQPGLLAGVDVGLLDPGVAAAPGRARRAAPAPRRQLLLQRQPQRLVDGLAPGRQPHEEVVAQQVGLGEPEPGVVERLEDPVHVVALLSGDRDQRQPRDDGVLDPLDVQRVVRVVGGGQLRGEEPVRRTDRVTPAGLRRRVQAGEVGGPVGLGG